MRCLLTVLPVCITVLVLHAYYAYTYVPPAAPDTVDYFYAPGDTIRQPRRPEPEKTDPFTVRDN